MARTAPPDGSPRRRWPLGLLGALALIAAAEGVLDRFDDALKPPACFTWNVTDADTRRRAVGRDVLVLGDSLAKFGVLPRIVAERSGRTVSNLAVAGGQAVSGDLLLRHALEAGADPDLVVFSVSARLLQLSPEHNAQGYPEIASAAELVEVGLSARDPELLGALVLRRLLPSFRRRETLRLMIADGSTDPCREYELRRALFARNLQINDSGLVQSPRPHGLGDLDVWMDGYFPDDWSCHPANERYLRLLLRRTADRGIPVAWLLMPLRPEVQDRCRLDGFDDRFDRFLDRLLDEYPHLSVIDGRTARYTHRHFWDPHHLARDGSIRASLAVAEVLGRPDLSGVVPLPDRPDGIAGTAARIEDFSETMAWLRDRYIPRTRR